MTTKERLQIFVNNHKDELLLDCSGDLVKLVGLSEDEDDFYWNILELRKPEIIYSSCVGRLIPLKGRIEQDEYDCLVTMFDRSFEFRYKSNPIV